MKQTAVEWFAEQVEQHVLTFGNIQPNVITKLKNLSKEMEKQQMEDLWHVAHQAGRFEGKGIAEENWQTFEQYYNETFKKEQ
jgi:hypothetical protein